MEIIVKASMFAGLDSEQRAEAEAEFRALGATIQDDGEHMARMAAAQATIRDGIFAGFMAWAGGVD